MSIGEEDVRDIIFDITDGLGADLIYDAVGGPGIEELAWATKRLGRIIIYGAWVRRTRPFNPLEMFKLNNRS
jgi:threonine dehydrogenase-like Zn-dependent dehydrogenase